MGSESILRFIDLNVYCKKEDGMNIRDETRVNRKMAMGFVIYEPEETIITRLNLALVQGFDLYIFDNSPEKPIVRDLCQSRRNLGNCKYITCGKNVGLGYGISSICAQAYYDSHRALIFFDQDTGFQKSTLDFIEDFYISNSCMSKNYSAVIFNSKELNKARNENKFPIKDILLGISSGSLFLLENLKKINWHKETYFVDCVDYEFCLNSNNHGLKVGECSVTPGFDHQSEQPDVKYLIFGKERLLRKYSRRRIWDTISASVKLLLSSVMTRNFLFFGALFRSLFIYVGFQLLARLVGIFKFKDRLQNDRK